jgi:hypothetical protein
MERVRIFISSPGDVAAERQCALEVVERLQEEFSGRLQLEPLLWEQEPLLATADFQSQIRSPADFDVFATIIGARLGSPLGNEFRRRDGSAYASGTEFEFEIAVDSHRASGRPELLVYRKSVDEVHEARSQHDKVNAFFDKWFPQDDRRRILGAYHSFAETGQFEDMFAAQLRELLQRLTPRPNNLPAPITSFLGRFDLIGQISEIFRQGEARATNLTGAGGVGKSRVALRAARGLLPDFEDGIYLVNLAHEGYAGCVSAGVAEALELDAAGERPILDILSEELREREILLLLDNVAGDSDEADEINALLSACPGVRALVTSEEALAISDSRAVVVQPFALPETAEATFADIHDCDCIQLFVDRAKAVREDFELTPENAPEVLEICRQLGGLPRPVELAASRMRSMNTTKMLRSLPSIKVRDETGQTVYLIPR